MARTALSPAEVDEVWRRWRSGQAVKVLAREMRRHPSTVRDLLKRTGGIRPVLRRRWELRLGLEEREEISRGLAAGESLRVIAARLGRAPSTVSREVGRNGGRAGYRALAADQAGARSSWQSSVVHEVDLDVVLVLNTCRLRIGWARRGLADGLSLQWKGEAGSSPDPAPPIVADQLPGWEPILGSVVSGIAVGWQDNEDPTIRSMWSVRFSTTSGRSVVVARGELDRSASTVVYEPGEDIVYFPGDALLVIFDEPAARALATLASFGSASGSSLEL